MAGTDMSVSSDICPHCGHLWDNHDGLLTGSNRCDVCDCMWTEPKPPPPPPTERDLPVDRIAKLLYDGICESCEGYVEDFSQYPNNDGIPSSEPVDGYVDFPMFAKYVIDRLGLGEIKSHDMSENEDDEIVDPVDVHRALQKAARELAFYADHGYEAEYREAIDRLEEKLHDVRNLTEPGEIRNTT